MAKSKTRRRRHTVHVVDGHPVHIPDIPGLDPSTGSGRSPQNIPFMGELMTCILCGKQQYSDPRIESNWRGIQIDGKRWYACPDEFPPDGASKEAFLAAYTRLLEKILEAQR